MRGEVRVDDGAETLLGETLDDVEDHHLVAEVEVRFRLVEHEDSGFGRERAGDERELELPARDFAAEAPREVLDADLGHDAVDPQDVLPSITFWMMGALTGATKSSVLAGTPMVLLGMLVLWLLRWRLNVTTLPTDEAASLGIPVRRIRAGVIIAATMITASVVSMCGLIGWVGLLVPHAARMIFGANNRFVLPASMVMGALFMLVIDTVARTATQSEIPVSILTAVVGAPFFIYLLRRTGGISG